ncbi:GntR family transcriptional regulator [Bailinhaonella thermotolerans]|uniref:GntR family transcriptional regulator n=1 Tax=Bailinhaonella thermotolerans TaxID=1070861 RepID=A0A3A4A5T7_9ACTN|nr:GntR family transcriptional regulator [Bailinhaonella thermotolerans]
MPERPEIPIYRQIADQLRAAILAGELRDGDRLPGENTLMREYGIARATARQALAVLINEGLAVARRGSGVYVRLFRPIRRHGSQRLTRWREGEAIWEADTRGRPYVVDAVHVERAEAPADVAAVLGSGQVWVRQRRYSVEERPVQLATSFYPAALAEGTRIAEADSGPGGVYARLRELGKGPSHFTEEIRGRMPMPPESRMLELPAGTPVLVVTRLAYTAEGEAVEFNQMIMDAAAYILQYDFEA